MNRKEIFEKVKTHLLTQGREARNGIECAYRAPNGDTCAIGCLIIDECYKPSLEGRSADHPSIIEALECSGIKVKMGDVYFLRQLQSIHDNNRVEGWPRLLDEFAKEHNL